MKHYICTGSCKGESEMPGLCNTAGCTKHNCPLMECKCTDKMHGVSGKKCEKCEKLCDGKCDLEIFKPELPK